MQILKMVRAVLRLLTIFFSIGCLYAEFENFKVSALRTPTPPIIDGKLDEKIWENAPQVSDFLQYVPNKGRLATVKTVVKILYDDKGLYFGFICYDPEPKKIQLGSNRRDGLTSSTSGSDSVTVELDTFNDDRSSFYFRTNPQGIQHDGVLFDNGVSWDEAWDTIWKSAGTITQEGWIAEIAIPFSSLKFNSGKNQIWGIQFSRNFPRNLEMDFWTGPLANKDRVSNYGSLTGLDLEISQKNLEMIPHIISQIRENKKIALNAGLDVNYDLSRSLSGHLTLNPDFATVEADIEQVNLTRFELNLPEKRNFFLEGNRAFQQKIRLFYSRRIEDIYGGLNVYGKSSQSEFSALTVQTKEKAGLESSANFSAFCLNRDIGKSTNVGFLVAKKVAKGMNYGTAELDATHSFSSTVQFAGQAAVSYGEGPADFLLSLRPSYSSNTLKASLSYNYLGDSFGDNANAVGFIQDDNRHELDSAISYTFWMKKWGLDRIIYSSKYNIYWGVDRTLRSWYVFQGASFDLKNKWSMEIDHDEEYKLYEKGFRNNATTIELGYLMREWESRMVSFQFGKSFDSDFTLIKGTVRKKITKKLSLEYNLSKLSLSPDPHNKSTWIHVILANQYFTKDLYLKVFYQIKTSIDKHNIQVVFVYRLQPPFGLVQLAYQKGTARLGEAGTQGHTLFLKVAYLF